MAVSSASRSLSAAEMLAQAEELFHGGRTDAARDLLESLLPLTHDDARLTAQVLSDLAVIAASGGGHGKAGRLASQALAHDPGHVPALEVLAHCAGAEEQRVGTLSREVQRSRAEELGSLSTCVRVTGEPIREQPVLLIGRGEISFGSSVQFGWHASPGFYDRYAYVEAAHHDTRVEIGDNTFFNNGATLRSEGPGISIGADCLFGWSVEILDSDFHDLDPRRRRSGTPRTGHVRIGNNVFVGANTIVMKGVAIGDDTVVGAASVVVQSLPAGVIAAGNPARVIRELGA